MGFTAVYVTCLLIASWPIVSADFFSSSGQGGRVKATSKDLRQADLTKLYNQKGLKVRIVERPLLGLGGLTGITHSGVQVKTPDGKEWLVHKGNNFGTEKGGNTVVTNAGHMSKDWKPTSQWKSYPESRISDLVAAGGKEYDAIRSNCHQCSENLYYGGQGTDGNIRIKPTIQPEDKLP